jgi:AcrR family transcriptional regulator
LRGVVEGGEDMAANTRTPFETTAPPMKKRDSERTRLAILAAAEKAFSTVGYTHVGVRDIAAEAGVDRALIVRYFGSKQGLFEAVLSRTLPVAALYQLDRKDFGKGLTAYFLSVGRDSPNPLRMMILAAADPAVGEVAMQMNQRLVIDPLAEWLGPPDAVARATTLIALWAGFFIYRRLGLPSLQQVEPATQRWLEATSQAIMDGKPH